jgi:parallel beta-helix repeat protein
MRRRIRRIHHCQTEIFAMRRSLALSILSSSILFLLALAPVREAYALTTACVNTPALLQSALTAAQSNNTDTYIRVVTGSYSLSAPVNVTIPAGYALTVEGGYAAGCSSAPTATAYNTTLTGSGGVSLKISVGDGALTLRNFTLTGFQPPASNEAISLHQAGYGGTLHVENVNVTGNTVASINDDVMIVDSQGGLVFDDNLVHDNPNARNAVHVHGNYPALPFVVANNTVVNNNPGTGLYFDVLTPQPSGLYNNILWHNGINNDLVIGTVLGSTTPLALNNIWLNCSGCGLLAAGSANNSSADPLLLSNYQPGNGSPAANAGVPLPLALPATDIQGHPRVVGSAPDQGAFEGTLDDLAAHTYVVTSNGDDANNTATLRGAITDANKKGVPARIELDSLINGCPMEIDLATPLPVITVPMIIDGYDANSAVNTAADSDGDILFNATLCTLLVNTGATANSAFSVASTAPSSQHLEVRGVRFASFGTAVNLAGGDSHWIHGNAFAAASLAVVGNGVGVDVSGGQADVIGGPAAADVNLIGASTGAAAVLIQGANGLHTVVNNNIGAGPTGGSGYANANNGVELLNASRDTVVGNMIEFSGFNGIILNNTSYSAISGNTVAFGRGPGVRVDTGSFYNFIGATSGGAFADAIPNFIVYNSGGPGVWIDATASNYNQVGGNSIAFNNGLAIDLAAQGPTVNTGSESSGPNQLLHKPVLTSALEVGGNTVQVTGEIATEAPNTYRYLTVYQNSNCGDADVMLGNFFVQSGADSIVRFSVTVSHQGSSLPIYINATDDNVNGAGITDTSEISNTRTIKPSDDVFYDGFNCY